MILRRRGEAVDRKSRAQLLRELTTERVEQRIEHLIARKELRLHEVFSDEEVHRLCAELNVKFTLLHQRKSHLSLWRCGLCGD